MSWCFKTGLNLPKGQISFVEKWPLMNPNDVAFILITYLLFVLKLGPYVMEKRQPFRIKTLLITYNTLKVVNSIFLVYKFIIFINFTGLFPRTCKYDDNTIYTIAVLYWKYMATKVLDLFDTIFFVLRKKHSQVTFLHVYHHVFMVMMTWSCLKYDPSDHWAFMAGMNCAIHMVMYVYYGLAAMGPAYSKYLWWKKYLTAMQLTQFGLVIGHLVVQTYTSQCPMHASAYWVGLSNLALFICLFTDFYHKRYGVAAVRNTEMVGFACTKQYE